VQVEADGALHYLHADHLNTPRSATDDAGEVVWRWESDAFGATAPQEDPDGDGVAVRVNLRFPGQYFDQETGSYQNYFRDYDPSTGRYLQSDPIGLDGGLNSYLYALANPLVWYDLNGQEPRGERGATGGSAGQNSNKPGKKCREFKPPRRNQVECQHHQTGKWSTHPRPDSMPYPGDESTNESSMCGDTCQAGFVLVGGACIVVACTLAPEICLLVGGVGAAAY
ncbi:MAG: RHS domain-containing protein, partial [Candidatus Thiodiazotropha sp. (ex Epidulcina cf. delphinae)]|nr:RHS domain-containing protein [Candidatus Thiodiazotropha sp. (ex Epidulcina cf. delphinae)]